MKQINRRYETPSVKGHIQDSKDQPTSKTTKEEIEIKGCIQDNKINQDSRPQEDHHTKEEIDLLMLISDMDMTQ